MFAIVEVAGQQFKVEKETRLFVHRLEEKEGEKIFLDKVLLIDNDGKVKIGMPVLKDARVSATVQAHVKGDKVKVFKKKRRKGYQVLNGHRQYFTEILIDAIEEKAAPQPKKEAQKTPEKKSETAEKSTISQAAAKTTTKGAAAPKAKPKTSGSTTKATPKKATAKPATKSTTKTTTAKKTAATTKAKSKPAATKKSPGTKTTAAKSKAKPDKK